MKTYVKTIEAIQFNGDMCSLTDFIGTNNAFTLLGDNYILVTPTKTWNVTKGDYVVKEYNGIVVFKEPRFLKDYALESKLEAKEETSFMDKVKAGTHMTTEELQSNKDVASPKPEDAPVLKKFTKPAQD